MPLPKLDDFIWHGDGTHPLGKEYLLDGLLPRIGTGLLIAPPAHGKSYLTIDLAKAIASGDKFAGTWEPTKLEAPLGKIGGTIIIAGEAGLTYERRLCAAYHSVSAKGKTRLSKAGLIHLPVCRVLTGDLSDEHIFDYHANQIREIIQLCDIDGRGAGVKIRLLVIDTLPTVFGFRDENSAAEVSRSMTRLAKLAEELEVFILATGHPAKAANKQRGMRGSGAFNGAVDVVMEAEKSLSPLKRHLRVYKSRYEEDDPTKYPFRIVPIELDDGARDAFVSGPARTHASGRESAYDLGLQAGRVKGAIQALSEKDWPPRAVTKEEIREHLKRTLPIASSYPTTQEVRKHEDIVRKTWERGIKRLIEIGAVETWEESALADAPLYRLTTF